MFLISLGHITLISFYSYFYHSSYDFVCLWIQFQTQTSLIFAWAFFQDAIPFNVPILISLPLNLLHPSLIYNACHLFFYPSRHQVTFNRLNYQSLSSYFDLTFMSPSSILILLSRFLTKLCSNYSFIIGIEGFRVFGLGVVGFCITKTKTPWPKTLKPVA
jgi:hypothetical protein